MMNSVIEHTLQVRAMAQASLTALLAFSGAAKADLLVVDTFAGASRYNEITGQFISHFTQGRFDETMSGCVFGPDGNLYVQVDDLGSDAILAFDGQSGAFLREAAPLGSLSLGFGNVLRFGPDGRLYAASRSGSILRYGYDPITGAPMRVFVNSGSGGLTNPVDLAFGREGDLYVADYNVGILHFEAQTGNFLSVFVPAAAGVLTNANGLVFGPDGDMYVADAGIIRCSGTNGSFISRFVEPGTGGLNRPAGLAFGPDDNLYVCSSGNSKIICYSGTTGAFLRAFDVPTQFGLAGPQSMAFMPRPLRLEISISAHEATINWPRSYTNYVLEFSNSLQGTNNWQLFTNPTIFSGGNFAVSNSILNERMLFFRLRKN